MQPYGTLGLISGKLKLEQFLEGKYSMKRFEIKSLPQKKSSHSMSFKVGADLELLEKFCKSENWTMGVTVKQITSNFFVKRKRVPIIFQKIGNQKKV